jgi:hypothetical protein
LKVLLEALFLLLAFLDAEFTKHKIADYGIEVELNPFIKYLVKYLKVDYAVDLAVVIPTFCFCLLGWYFPKLLIFLLGFRTCLFSFQLHSRD